MNVAIVVAVFGLLLLLAGAVFWLWMLIDVLSKQEQDKVVWLLVVFFLGPLGALLHYLIGRKKRMEAAAA